jgi:hypothetical protein
MILTDDLTYWGLTKAMLGVEFLENSLVFRAIADWELPTLEIVLNI